MRGGEEVAPLAPVPLDPTPLPSAEEQGSLSSWFSSTTNDVSNQAQGLLTDLKEEATKTTSDATNYLKDAMPSNSVGEPVAVAVGEPLAVGEPVAPGEAPKEKPWYKFWGGRRRGKSKSMKMKGGLNSAFGYYAAPVTDSVTAQPTYMMKYDGGRRCKRRTCKRKGCKKRQTCRHLRRSRRH